MSTTIDQAFITQFETEVHAVFQRKGSHLRQAVRTKDNVRGSSTTFQKIGKGTATTKARHGVITPMNQTHTAISCSLSDFYAGDWVDKLDEAKINIDERMAIAEGGAMALGRKVDDQLTTAMTGTTQTAITWAYGSIHQVENSMLTTVRNLDSADVPNDGNRYAVLTPTAYAAAQKVPSFMSSDFVSIRPAEDGQPVDLGVWRRWMGVMWKSHTGLPSVGTASAEGYAWHRMAVGYATAAVAGNAAQGGPVAADITWHGDRAAHFVNNMMSGGACLIDDTGCYQLTLDDTAALPLISST